METPRNFVAGSLTAGYLNGLIKFNETTDYVFSLVSGEYGEDSSIVKDYLAAADAFKEELLKLMNYSVENSLSFKDSYKGSTVEI